MPKFLKQFDPDLAAAAEKAAAPSGGALSEDQFNVLVEMLTPGYELSSLMLADYKSQHPDRFPIDEPAEPATDGGATS